MHRQGSEIWWIVAAVVGHFFLFCNVFRIRRSLELWWAAIFVINAGWWLFHDQTGWLPTMGYQAPVTLIVIIIEMCSPWYHGIGAQRINRRLDEYLNDKL
jgi:hypothetical protein